LSKFLFRNGLAGAWQVGWELEDLVNGIHQDVSDYLATVVVSLHHQEEVIDEDVSIGQWLRQRHVGSYLFRRRKRGERSLIFVAKSGRTLRGRWFGWRRSHLGSRDAL